MPEMATVCQETTANSPNMFASRGAQGAGPAHSYYNHCGYASAPGHGQYSAEVYGPFQSSPSEQPSHLQHTVHGHAQPHHQQAWGYGVMGGPRHGVLSDEWAQGYLVPSSHAPAQSAYNYQYRGPSSHGSLGALDYAGPIQAGHNPDQQDLEGSSSPNCSSPGEPVRMGANNQGAKSLRAPYEWMKPSASLPQAGKTRTKDKYRVVYSDHQRLELEKEFHFSKYITIRRKAEIASQLGLSERQVKIWFQNRRAKERKQNKKREEQVSVATSNSIGNSGHELQQRLHHSASHESNQHSFITKLEMDEDKSSLHDLTCHSTSHVQGAGLSSHAAPPTVTSLHPNLYHSPTMTMSPIILGRNHSLATIGHYHDNVHTSTISPNTTSDDVIYRMGQDNGVNMNLSGSSDSGVVSSH